MALVESGMYKVKPIFTQENFEINSPMYSMKNVHNLGSEISNKSSSNDLSVEEVEAKQAVLLKIIDQIKDLLALLRKELAEPKIDSKSRDASIMPLSKPIFSEVGVNHEVVLNASIKNPPNSLLVLKHLWGNIKFSYSWHVHSSAKGLPKTLKKFENINGQNNNENPDIRIRVVWKEVGSDCELVVSPLHSVPLLGEVNFLRFLNRCISQDITDPYASALFDSKLDACHSLSYCENIQQYQEYYSVLSDGLDKTKWLVGDNISIVDLACWSAVNNMKNPNLNALLSRWYKDFNTLVA